MTYHGDSDEEDVNLKAEISDDSELDNSEVLRPVLVRFSCLEVS